MRPSATVGMPSTASSQRQPRMLSLPSRTESSSSDPADDSRPPMEAADEKYAMARPEHESGNHRVR